MNYGVAKAAPEEILQFVLDNGMLDLSTYEAMIEMKTRKEYLTKHPYKIYQSGDGKWQTSLPDETKKEK